MPDIITGAQLTAFLPAIQDPARWVGALNAAMVKFEINTPVRAAAFLAQTAHESAEFRTLVENLNYSAAGLCKTWPNRFASLDFAKPYDRNPELIANYVYAKRLGNGDVASGDGWRFRGRGLIQLTGRGNYRSCGTAIALPLEAEPERPRLQPGAEAAAHERGLRRGCAGFCLRQGVRTGRVPRNRVRHHQLR